ncbi:DgyrCDS604 [Dimorphilus gyrociliatus]|uniref:DgyrCDS604 n=1 Tax=Dimorphilus gyrociliatus TaxID=2664684 RepID=A0A7I8V7M9_9ANNE|nr:DgyrCDS604 [Dimorphilus gyrociliatus]
MFGGRRQQNDEDHKTVIQPNTKTPTDKTNRSFKPYNFQARPFYENYKKSQPDYKPEKFDTNTNFLSNDKFIEMSLAIPKLEENCSGERGPRYSGPASNEKTISQNLFGLDKSDIEAPEDLEQTAEGQSMMREIGLTDAHAAINPGNWFTSDMKKLERRIQYASQMGWMLVSFERSALAKLQHERNIQSRKEIGASEKVEEIESRLSKLERNWKPPPRNIERAGKNLFRFRFR